MQKRRQEIGSFSEDCEVMKSMHLYKVPLLECSRFCTLLADLRQSRGNSGDGGLPPFVCVLSIPSLSLPFYSSSAAQLLHPWLHEGGSRKCLLPIKLPVIQCYP